MIIDALNDTMYHLYDKIIGDIFSELAKHNIIQLVGFNRKNKEHLLILRIALMVRDLYDTKIEIDARGLDRFLINRKIVKNFGRVEKIEYKSSECIGVDALVSKIRGENDHLYLDSIYDAYYEGSCD